MKSCCHMPAFPAKWKFKFWGIGYVDANPAHLTCMEVLICGHGTTCYTFNSNIHLFVLKRRVQIVGIRVAV